jgi:hypothetical protein
MANEDPAPTESTPVPPIPPAVPPAVPSAAPPAPAAPPQATRPAASGLAVPPAAPSTEPTWRPPPADSGRIASLIFGIVLIVIGLWFFATTTLGLSLPRLDWGQLWPILLIGLGLWVLLRSMGRQT